MRIRVTESIAVPFVTRFPDGSVELVINTELSFEDIKTFIGQSLSQEEIATFYSLWADDEADRRFIPVDGSTDFYIDKR